MFRVTRYPLISKTESGQVGYRKKYRVAGRVRVPAGHCTSGAGKDWKVGRGVIGVGRELGEWKCSPSVPTPVIAGFIAF